MFEHLKGHDRILVTGPHRSGTTITGRMIAYDLDRLYCTESQIRSKYNRALCRDFVVTWIKAQNQPWVLHGASCWQWLTDLQKFDIAIVFVMRNVKDIQASQQKANKILDNPAEKQAEWLKLVASGRIHHPYTVKYEDLTAHPLWVSDRSDWHRRQITPTETAFTTTGGKC